MKHTCMSNEEAFALAKEASKLSLCVICKEEDSCPYCLAVTTELLCASLLKIVAFATEEDVNDVIHRVRVLAAKVTDPQAVNTLGGIA